MGGLGAVEHEDVTKWHLAESFCELCQAKVDVGEGAPRGRPNAWVSLGRIAAHYDVSYLTVWRDLKAGGLPFARVGRKRVIRVRVKDALQWGDPS